MSESFAAGLVGIVLDDRYRLDALLGEGGMGAVFRAHHLAMDRKVAVKLLKPHLTSDEAALQRFVREARSTMKVESDHAVKVLDFGVTPHRDYYMVLEYLDGRTVQRELDIDGPFAPLRVVHIAKQALRALGAAHDRGLVHRDIKPDNILLMRVGDDADYAKVLDFGVAKLMDGAAGSSKSALAITQAGMVFGTPEFMSPEQSCGQPLDGRSDLYSLAATMFAMLTGCGMYKATAPIEWLTHHARTPPPHLTDGLPSLAPYKQLDAALQRCLAKRPEARPQTALEMIDLLTSVEGSLRGAPPPSTGLSPARTAFSSSTFVARIDPNATLLPNAPPVVAPTPSSSVEPLPARSGRGTWLVLGASAVVAMIVAVIVVASSREKRSNGVVAAKQTEAARNDAAAPLPPDAPSDVVAVVDAAVVVAAVPDAGVVKSAGPTRPRGNPEIAARVAAHIAAAEQAKQVGNRLRQLAEADAALQADPRNVRARLLFADALIAAGDLDRGCRYLRGLGRNPTAQARARQAGCPTD